MVINGQLFSARDFVVAYVSAMFDLGNKSPLISLDSFMEKTGKVVSSKLRISPTEVIKLHHPLWWSLILNPRVFEYHQRICPYLEKPKSVEKDSHLVFVANGKSQLPYVNQCLIEYNDFIQERINSIPPQN